EYVATTGWRSENATNVTATATIAATAVSWIARTLQGLRTTVLCSVHKQNQRSPSGQAIRDPGPEGSATSDRPSRTSDWVNFKELQVACLSRVPLWQACCCTNTEWRWRKRDRDSKHEFESR